MIFRGAVGKRFPPFFVRISQSLVQELLELTKVPELPPLPLWPPPSNWPALLSSHGTACLIGVWEELDVDPLQARLVWEEFLHFTDPVAGETLTGHVAVSDISRYLEPSRGIEELVEFEVSFRNSAGDPVAVYRCAFRVPLLPQVSRDRGRLE